jgi:dTMP kinase
MTQPGRFISFEGIDGSGKTTCVESAAAWLRHRGIPVKLTREPGGTPVGEAIRQILLNTPHPMLPETETLLMFAVRNEHVHRVVVPALNAGTWVLCDRFIDATLAYQGAGRGVAVERIASLMRWVHPTLKPDITLLMHVDLAVAAERIGGRGDRDRFEAEADSFHRRVSDEYLRIAAQETQRVHRIDGTGTPEAVRLRVETTLALAVAGLA